MSESCYNSINPPFVGESSDYFYNLMILYMKKNHLLSIGELSKITGVHIKALRYYDSLGILKPAFVDPDSGYRYYSFYQKAIVDAIQLCVDVDIPLKHFSDYTNEESAWIQYRDIVAQGLDSIETKIQTMQERLERLKTMQTEIGRAEVSFHSEKPQYYNLPSRTCWITPYDGQLGNDNANEIIKKSILEIYRNGLKLGDIHGLILLRCDNDWKQFLFVDVKISGAEREDYPKILHIPAGQYLCKKVEKSSIVKAWDWILPMVSESQIKLVIETELFIGNYTFSNPVLEQRCLLNAGNIEKM